MGWFISLERLIKTLRDEHPNATEECLEFKARAIRRELYRLEKSWQRSQRRFNRCELFGEDFFENSSD